MRSRRILGVLALSLIALPAQAALVIHYDFDELAEQADEVVHGRVVGQTSYWDGQVIMTQVTVEVLDSLKGEHSPGERVMIVQQGGAVDDLAMVVPGMPRFADDEEVILFLEATSVANVTMVMGLAQGKFSVLTDPINGERLVTRDLTGLARVDAAGRYLEPAQPVGPTGDQALGGLATTSALDGPLPEQVRAGPVRARFDAFMIELGNALAEEAR